jgi:hypothetical protein
MLQADDWGSLTGRDFYLSHRVKTDYVVQQTPQSMSTGGFFSDGGRGMNLTTHLHVLLGLNMRNI